MYLEYSLNQCFFKDADIAVSNVGGGGQEHTSGDGGLAVLDLSGHDIYLVLDSDDGCDSCLVTFINDECFSSLML